MRAMLRIPAAGAQMGVRRTAMYEQIKNGLLPPLVKIGRRAVAWPANEIEAVIAARIAGQTDTQIRALVQRLVADRSARLASILSATPAQR